MKKNKLSREAILAFEKDTILDEKWFIKQNNAACWFYESKSVLWFREWKNDWEHWDTLLHECYHLIHTILHKDKNMAKDDEGCAYQLEYLFRNIRRTLWGLKPKFTNK